ncbi:CCR4-NOT transcription complex subunit 6-like [Physella acuta]|uniref:CCR4-NOT transcription complex subunit 6-like n=1 Tax=Physella acuta TaxID=109671 RepID=UPI0027DC6B53|nr:CCR4-NOT transcription complex subunit 6-like [Physella acuta]
MPKDKYEPPNERRQHRIMQRNEVAEGKQSRWSELEIFGFVQNLSGNLWKVEWLTVLYLDNNHLSHLPAQIGSLVHLEHLDASHNFITVLPPEIGELVNLRELKLASNRLRDLPYELGKCFQIQTLDLSNNPLSFDVSKYYTESSAKLLSALMDSLHWLEVIIELRRARLRLGALAMLV